MPRVSDVALLKKPRQPVLVIPKRTRIEELPGLIAQSYGKLAAYVESIGGYLSEAPFVFFLNTDMSDLSVEIGFPVSEELPGTDEITARVIPESLVVFAIHRGAYNEIEPTYEDMATWIKEHGLTSNGTSFEQYLNGPPFPMEEMLTTVLIPVERS